MAEIRTSAFTAGDIVTTHQPPESVRDWVDRHADAVKAATPAGTTLTTEWPDTCALTTYQKEDETKTLHLARHWFEVRSAMGDDPPDPN